MAVFTGVLLWVRTLPILDLPPNSVGGSVDKMFAISYRPYKQWFSVSWLYFDQFALFVPINREMPRFMKV